ncbi:MAG TPA: TrkA family potassium uptake protein [Dermatophilaceae bacterium]|nr:TrkA family potassium uptake protein [Dermatophilaceae bacterium]
MAGRNVHEAEVLVVGLGRFGGASAVELRRLGHRVTAIERDGLLAERFLGRVAHVIHGDGSDPDVIREAKPQRFRVAVVGIGAVEASVLAVVNLVDAGIADVWAKATSPEHARILTRIGVTHVVRPEADTGRRVAHLVGGRLQDYIEFDDGFAIVKMRPPNEAIGFTLEQSQIRSRYGVTVVGVKAPGQDFTYAVASTKVSAHDTLIVSGPTELLERLASRP